MFESDEGPAYFCAGISAGAATPLALIGWPWAAAYCVLVCVSLTALAMLVEAAPVWEDHI